LFGQLTQRYHFTVSEQGHLKNRLSRWTTLTQIQVPDFDQNSVGKGKDILVWLDQQLSELEFFL